MELAISICLFAAMCVAWCILPNGPAPATRDAQTLKGAAQEA